ncbi:MAG: NAD(P)H-dependent oxidoreductase subunit E [Sulfurimonas sp.]|uniref:NADH-quinone oxidoreductase subunit NuoE family protein n=1 Tax=Sulfurimonas sp. TaxID=2022749 RepID=UPI0026025199|nr:NAD(P)H-dependent oxidoreductase subunit E [Sulfurimonas sp.]MCW8895719.1 NAD(P)H-dependent oxidoreductase subunit E [Sulfurimonas sp.]MCW8953528.1 NAD(P)H-dependent oxidoreductase subunit E [Sulfurimonas sp.]MCW9068233.1 NAD(P)H-dependent oxidoreductase subunit E [Sulfurimonas sp.]
MSFSFSQENSIKIASLLNRYPHKKALILPLLWFAQKQESYISEDAIGHISEFLDVPYMHIYSVVTFYTMFRLTKPQKRVIEVCATLSCELNGSEDIKAYLDENYSKDFEVIEVECMGACSGAPMCAIDGKYHENLTTKTIDEVLK